MRHLTSWLCLALTASLSACSADGDSAGSGGNGAFGGSGGSSAGTNNGGASGAGATAGSSASGGSGNGGSGAGGSGAGGSGATSGSSGNGGNGGTEDAGFPDATFTYDAPIIVEDACAATRIEADPIPLDMYFVLDDSGSMRLPQSSYAAGDCNVGGSVNSRWCYAINALWSFFNAPESVGVGVALNYFNNGFNCGSTNGLSTPPAGSTVAFDVLPNHINALQTSLNAARGDGTTPTQAALKSIVTYTSAQAALRPGRQMVGVLITDGIPEATNCNGNANVLQQIVSDHYNATGIPTFIIGMDGASFAALEQWGTGAGATQHTNYCGGANPCYSYSVGTGSGTVFVDVLKEIQKAAVGCTFNLPTPDSGILDINNIDVIYTPGGGGAAQTLTRVTDQSQCGSAPGQGWYYDDNTNPTQIILCPDTCNTVSADSGAKIDVELGCLGS